MAHVTVATDNFNRANAATLGANWTIGVGGKSVGIVSNQAANNTASADCNEYWSANSFANDQYAQAILNQLNTGANDFSGVFVRGSATDYVVFQANQNGGNVQIVWYNAAAFTVLATDAGATGNPTGKTFLLEVVGSSYTAYLNGVSVLTATNVNTPSTGNAGIILSGTNVNASLWDTWEGGNITSGAQYYSPLATLGCG